MALSQLKNSFRVPQGDYAKRRVRAAAAERTVLKHHRRLGATPKTVRSATAARTLRFLYFGCGFAAIG